MATPSNQTVAVDGSDLVAVQYIQTTGAPAGGSETFNVRGFNIDQVAALANAKTSNVMTGNFTANH